MAAVKFLIIEEKDWYLELERIAKEWKKSEFQNSFSEILCITRFLQKTISVWISLGVICNVHFVLFWIEAHQLRCTFLVFFWLKCFKI